MKCPKCQYVRKPSDDDLAPEWQCPSCKVAYSKIGSTKFSASPKKTPPQKPIKDQEKAIEHKQPRVDLRSFLVGMTIASVVAVAFVVWESNKSSSTLSAMGPPISLGQLPSRQSIDKPTTKQPDQEQDLSEIQQEMANLQKRIETTRTFSERYSGGLIKSVLDVTQAIQQQSLEMLEQRENSWTFGIGLNYAVDGTEFLTPQNNEALIQEIDREISSTKQHIAEAEAKAARYSGGLIRATLLTTSATGQQTLAMLNQKKLALRFRLPQFIGFNQGASPPQATIPSSPPLEPKENQWEIVNIETRVTEKNNVYWQYSWKLTLKNSSDMAHSFKGEIEFQDDDGFVIKSDNVGTLYLAPGELKTFTGKSLVRLPGAQKVGKAYAKVRQG